MGRGKGKDRNIPFVDHHNWLTLKCRRYGIGWDSVGVGVDREDK